jgi:hypothetical protein
MNILADKSKINYGSSLRVYTQDEVKNEPMLFNCDIRHSIKYGKSITLDFLMSLPMEILKNPTFIFDSRVHMLMKGWFPCIPGFHHDDVERTLATGQPNYINPSTRSNHAFALVNGDICPTEFALGDYSLEIPEEGIIYKEWHPKVQSLISDGLMTSHKVKSNQVIFFNDRAFHQGTKAVENGWRWFGRASWDTTRKPTNEIRNQVQVYLEFPMEGW